MTTPRRYRLTNQVVAGALAAAGLQAHPASGLPAPNAADRKRLRAAGVLAGDALEPSLGTALGVLSAPGRVLRVKVNRPGKPGWVETRLTTTTGQKAVVAWADRGDEFDLVVFEDAGQAAILVDELLGLTDFVAGEPSQRYDLSLPALVALCAAADRLQQAALVNRLERALRRPPPALVVSELASLVEEGLRADDTRWAVSALAGAAPTAVGADAAALEAGLAELVHARLVEAAAAGSTLSAPGFVIADALTQLLSVGLLSLGVAGPGSPATATPITVFRCATAIWAVLWHAGAESGVAVTLFELDAAAALGIVVDLLGDLEIAPEAAPAAATSAAAPVAVDPVTLVSAESESPRLAGLCAQCGSNVWLVDWRCSKGHPREAVTGWYDPASGTRVTPPWLGTPPPPPPLPPGG
ncbi:MAG: hypothetical protein WEE36_01805 [Acidimicrobiia bacterium]